MTLSYFPHDTPRPDALTEALIYRLNPAFVEAHTLPVSDDPQFRPFTPFFGIDAVALIEHYVKYWYERGRSARIGLLLDNFDELNEWVIDFVRPDLPPQVRRTLRTEPERIRFEGELLFLDDVRVEEFICTHHGIHRVWIVALDF